MVETSVSLLDRLRDEGDDDAWRRLDDLYRPLVRRWLLRDPDLGDEADDLVQDVMTVLVRELPKFQRRRSGSFRRWLRTITVHRLQEHWRQRRRRPSPQSLPSGESQLFSLADPDSDLSREWDREHDHHVLRRLLELVEGDFTAATWQAFRRAVVDEAEPKAAAAELGLTVNAVLLAKSRVLKRLREESRGLID